MDQTDESSKSLMNKTESREITGAKIELNDYQKRLISLLLALVGVLTIMSIVVGIIVSLFYTTGSFQSKWTWSILQFIALCINNATFRLKRG